MRDNIFTVHARTNPLSYILGHDANGLAHQAAYAPTFEDLNPFIGDAMARTIDGLRREPLQLGPLLPGRTGDGAWHEVAGGGRIQKSRLFYDIQVLGDEELLSYWPDKNDAGLRPVNQELMNEIGDERTASEADAKRYYDSITWWTSRSLRAPSGDMVPVLSTWADLRADEVAQPAKHQEVRTLFRQRHDDAEAIVAAMAGQMATWYDSELPEALRVRAAARQEYLGHLHTAFETIGLPTEWKMDPPVAVEVAEAPSAVTEGLPVPVRARLEPVSYRDIQKTIRIWADKVEEYPEAFTALAEDRISDLLCATLHAATPGAGREVFSRGGKTDIHIRGDVLREGLGPASVFVLESKWVEGKEDIESAIADQLMRYIPVAATSTVLLALSRRSGKQGAVDNVRSWAREVTGFDREDGEDVEGWPIFVYKIADLDDLEMRVSIATVHVAPVPRTRAQLATGNEADATSVLSTDDVDAADAPTAPER